MSDNSSNVDDTTQDAGQNKKNKLAQESGIKKKIRKTTAGAVKKVAKKAITTFLAPFLGIIVVLFMVIGIAAFILTMPGLVQSKIYDTITSAIAKVEEELFLGGSDHIISADKLKDNTIAALNHLNDMGLDPVGLGFAQRISRDSEGKINDFYDIGSYVNSFKIDGGDELAVNKIPTACPLLNYVLCSEKTYLPKDYYIKTDMDSSMMFFLWRINDENIIDPSETVNPLTQSKYAKMNNGMLDLDTTGINKNDITINTNEKTMKYMDTRVLNGILSEQGYTVDLENWIGRFGTPLELLTALHIATMSSDVADEFVSNKDLQTDVKILFDDGDYDIDFKIFQKKEDGTQEDLGVKFGKLYSEGLTFNNDLIALEEKYHFIGVQKVYNEELGRDQYQYVFQPPETAEGDYSKDAITICSLKAFIEELIAKTRYADSEYEQEYTNGYAALETSLEDFLYGSGVYAKYDVNLNPEQNNFPQMAACLGSGGAGLLDSNGFFSYDWDLVGEVVYNTVSKEEEEKTVTKEGENGEEITETTVTTYFNQWNGFTGDPPSGMKVNLQDPRDSRTVVRLGNIEDYRNKTGKGTDVIDAVTCLMIEIDQFFYDKLATEAHEEDNFINVTLSSDAKNKKCRLTFTYNDDFYGYENIDTMEIQDYNFLINVSGVSNNSNGVDMLYVSKIPGTCTKLWLEHLRNPENDEIFDKLLETLCMNYDIIHDMDNNIQRLLDGIWTNIIDPENAEKCPITKEDIFEIYQNLGDFMGWNQVIKLAYPRIESVIHHWFKDLDFSEAYDKGPYTLEVAAYEDEKIATTALLYNDQHTIQKRQPYVIKGDVVTLDGEVVDDHPLSSDKEIGDEFGKGYEASKKILTSGYYYIYDGTEATSNSILYSKLIENVQPGSSVEVAVSDTGCIVFAKLAGTGGSVEEATESANSDYLIQEGEDVEKTDDQGDITEVIHHYTVTIPESLQYVSAAEDPVKAKESAEKINDFLEQIGVTHLREPVSFDRSTSDGDVTALTAFSILEGMKSESSQTIYRDFKEFLIDLGYYTKAEFDNLGYNVLDWFIPKYKPANAAHWAQNDDEDVLLYGAIIYPESEYDDSTEGQETGDSDTEEQETDDSDTEDEHKYDFIEKGFAPDLDVVAPGNAKVLECGSDEDGSYVTLEFDGVSQPEIALLDKYTMTIKGISVEASAGSEVEAGSVIGKTGTEKIQVILKNASGAILNNVEDYMRPPETLGGDQEYPFTKDEIILLAYVITHEGPPEDVVEYTHENSVYENPEDEAMAYSEGIGYVLINRALSNYGGNGTTIEEQTTAPGQYAGSYTIANAKANISRITQGSMEAALHCAQYSCESITNPDGKPMSKNIRGQSAWPQGEIFWWLDTQKNGIQDWYPTGVTYGWPWDNYLAEESR